jgi:hypothetical protein
MPSIRLGWDASRTNDLSLHYKSDVSPSPLRKYLHCRSGTTITFMVLQAHLPLMARWPSGLRRQNQDLVRKGVSSNLTLVRKSFCYLNVELAPRWQHGFILPFMDFLIHDAKAFRGNAIYASLRSCAATSIESFICTMGVHGLTTYLREHMNTLSKRLECSADFGRINVVVDGWS